MLVAFFNDFTTRVNSYIGTTLWCVRVHVCAYVRVCVHVCVLDVLLSHTCTFVLCCTYIYVLVHLCLHIGFSAEKNLLQFPVTQSCN